MKTLTSTETHHALTEAGLNDQGNRGFAFRNPSAAIFYDWHEHPCHQITYARSGTTQIEGPDGRHLLPTRHAIWIPASTPHRTMIRELNGVSVYFDPAQFPRQCDPRIQIFPVSALVREMLFYTLCWPVGPAEQASVAQSWRVRKTFY